MNPLLDRRQRFPLLAGVGASKRENATRKLSVLKGNHHFTQSVGTLWGAAVLAELEVIFRDVVCGFVRDGHGVYLRMEVLENLPNAGLALRRGRR